MNARKEIAKDREAYAANKSRERARKVETFRAALMKASKLSAKEIDKLVLKHQQKLKEEDKKLTILSGG